MSTNPSIKLPTNFHFNYSLQAAKQYCLLKYKQEQIFKAFKEEFDADENLVGHTKGGGGEHLKGTISVLNEDGITIRIPKDEYDPKIHVGHTKGKTTYKDKHGNTYQCSKDDPRVISGELFGINKGRKYKQKTHICPHCKKEGKGGAMLQHHFKNCKKLNK